MLVIEKQGSVVRLARLTPVDPPPANLTKRGKVSEFSRKARRRLIDIFCRLDVLSVRKTFVTLTFHRWLPPYLVKEAFKRFLARLNYHYKHISGIWRVELQTRGVAHYHLILLNLPYIPQKRLQAVWTECTGEDLSIAHITLIRSSRMAMSYVSKYIAKTPEEQSDTSLINAPYQQNLFDAWDGRHWGYINKEELPFAPRSIAIIADEEIAYYFLWAAGARITRRDGEKRNTMRMYTQEARKVYEFVLQHGGADITDCWQQLIDFKSMSASMRTKAKDFFLGVHTHL